jgi:hypothetical protein
MNALRRPEVIVLLVLVFAGIAWVIHDVSSRRVPDHDHDSRRKIEITSIEVIPDGAHRRLRIELVASNTASTPIEMAPPAVRLLDATGTAVPEFFQPGMFAPSLPPATEAASWLEYWLTESQLAGPLQLEIDGQQIAVTP